MQPLLPHVDRGGRPRKLQKDYIPHRPRPAIARPFAAHVTLKLLPLFESLRARKLYAAVRRAFVAGCDRFGFRLVHYSVQRDHVHLIAEAEDRAALSRGLQGLAIRIAKGINKLLGQGGQVFKERYHLHVLETPREVRNALQYVLDNAVRHARRLGRGGALGDVDGCSSAGYFDGWASGWWSRRIAAAREPDTPVARARNWLLTTGWRRLGLLVPGG